MAEAGMATITVTAAFDISPKCFLSLTLEGITPIIIPIQTAIIDGFKLILYLSLV